MGDGGIGFYFHVEMAKRPLRSSVVVDLFRREFWLRLDGKREALCKDFRGSGDENGLAAGLSSSREILDLVQVRLYACNNILIRAIGLV